MRSWTLAFLCGVLILQTFTFLPSKEWVVYGVLLTFFIEFIFRKRYPYLRYISAFLLGFSWVLWYVLGLYSWNLPVEWEGKPLIINGYIDSIPDNTDSKISFLFLVENFQSKKIHSIIKLSSQDENLKSLHAGDKWQFKVKLKRIHGVMNPGGFDYESWALQEGIRANGYIVISQENQLLESHWYHGLLNRIREKLKNKIEVNLPQSNTSPWIVALALGERQNISAENWEILRNTGTNHLMAIAGLHIGLMSSFIFLLASWCWRRISKLMFIFPAQLVGGFCAFMMAILYSALAGFSIPAERTCIMLSIALITLIAQRVIAVWQAWSIALLAVLLINPLCVLTESFWLSFCSVALIIFGVSGRLNPHNLWWKIGRIQWVITVGLIPLGIGLFQQFSIISFIANSIAIPWIGFVIVPLTLLGCFILIFSAKCGGLILLLADKLLAILWQILTYFSHLSWGNIYLMMPNNWILFTACIAIIILLLPSGFPGKWFGVIGFLPLIFYQYPAPKSGEIRFSLLDVGQGLSAVIQTHKHVLVFDAGPKLSPNYDMGESVVTPFLRSIGIKKIDMLVISHPDNDHIGGANALFHYFKILKTKTSTPDRLVSFPSEYCFRGESWKWDEVNFTFLYPTSENLNLDNDSSCVLFITNKKNKSILLTGDIEKFAEKYLIQNDQKNLATDILVAPHHGSKTSAVSEFVEYAHPRFVLFPVGYLNRYHFPHVSVIEKYQQIHADLFETDRSGTIQFNLAENIPAPTQYRLEKQRYWNFH